MAVPVLGAPPVDAPKESASSRVSSNVAPDSMLSERVWHLSQRTQRQGPQTRSSSGGRGHKVTRTT